MLIPVSYRGRGVATDVRRNPMADRPAAGAARGGMTSAGPSTTRNQRERYARNKQIGAFQRWGAPSIALGSGQLRCALLKPARGLILAENHWESGECQVIMRRDQEMKILHLLYYTSSYYRQARWGKPRYWP